MNVKRFLKRQSNYALSLSAGDKYLKPGNKNKPNESTERLFIQILQRNQLSSLLLAVTHEKARRAKDATKRI